VLLPRAIGLASVHHLVRGFGVGPRSRSSGRGEVVDDLPEHIPVLPGELKAIETFLAAVVDASLEPIGLYTEKPGSEPAKDS